MQRFKYHETALMEHSMSMLSRGENLKSYFMSFYMCVNKREKKSSLNMMWGFLTQYFREQAKMGKAELWPSVR